MSPERLAEALEAWNTRDAERVLGYFIDDCAYHASFGPGPLGRSYLGRDEVTDGVRRFFERYPDGCFEDTRVFVAGDRGAAEWTFVATELDGTELRVRGCDLFEFDGELIRTKNAFRKLRDAD
jgi:ketosteroid isomerase-like protein